MTTIISIIVVLVLMTVVIFFILKNTVSNINEQGRVYFTLKLQQYDQEAKEQDNNEEDKGIKEESNNETVESKIGTGSVVYVEKSSKYEVDNLFEMVKKINQKFSLNNEEIIKKFVANRVDEDGIKKYNKLIEVRNHIQDIGVYNILTTQEEGYIEKVQDEIKEIDSKIYQRYITNKGEFEIEDFLNYLENEIGTCDPTIYILVGDKSENYNELDTRIKTIYDKKVYKGVKIIYKNKMYDYSLS